MACRQYFGAGKADRGAGAALPVFAPFSSYRSTAVLTLRISSVFHFGAKRPVPVKGKTVAFFKSFGDRQRQYRCNIADHLSHRSFVFADIVQAHLQRDDKSCLCKAFTIDVLGAVKQHHLRENDLRQTAFTSSSNRWKAWGWALFYSTHRWCTFLRNYFDPGWHFFYCMKCFFGNAEM